MSWFNPNVATTDNNLMEPSLTSQPDTQTFYYDTQTIPETKPKRKYLRKAERTEPYNTRQRKTPPDKPKNTIQLCNACINSIKNL